MEGLWITRTYVRSAPAGRAASSLLAGIFKVTEADSAPVRVAPILAEGLWTNNAAQWVIHSFDKRASCVFHTIHNFSGFLVVRDERYQPGRPAEWESQPAHHPVVCLTPRIRGRYNRRACRPGDAVASRLKGRNSREAYVPAKQSEACKDAWLSRSHGHPWWTRHYRCSPS
jgi:hypothetical protein